MIRGLQTKTLVRLRDHLLVPVHRPPGLTETQLNDPAAKAPGIMCLGEGAARAAHASPGAPWPGGMTPGGLAEERWLSEPPGVPNHGERVPRPAGCSPEVPITTDRCSPSVGEPASKAHGGVMKGVLACHRTWKGRPRLQGHGGIYGPEPPAPEFG